MKGSWNNVFHALKENNFQPRQLYPQKLLFTIEGGKNVRNLP
jgi:hypothetical protein